MAHKLSCHCAVRTIYYSHGHLLHHLIVIYPGIEHGIKQGHKDDKEQRALILENLPILVHPDLCYVYDVSDYFS